MSIGKEASCERERVCELGGGPASVPNLGEVCATCNVHVVLRTCTACYPL